MEFKWVNVLHIGLGLAGGALISIIICCADYHIKGEVWAAWVQAVGSILAIGVAIWIPVWRENVHRRERVSDTFVALMSLSNSARKMAELLQRRLSTAESMDKHRRASHKNHLKPLSEILSKIDVQSVVASKSMGSLMNLQNYSSWLSDIWDEIAIHGDKYSEKRKAERVCRLVLRGLNRLDEKLEASHCLLVLEKCATRLDDKESGRTTAETGTEEVKSPKPRSR